MHRITHVLSGPIASHCPSAFPGSQWVSRQHVCCVHRHGRWICRNSDSITLRPEGWVLEEGDSKGPIVCAQPVEQTGLGDQLCVYHWYKAYTVRNVWNCFTLFLFSSYPFALAALMSIVLL